VGAGCEKPTATEWHTLPAIARGCMRAEATGGEVWFVQMTADRWCKAVYDRAEHRIKTILQLNMGVRDTHQRRTR